MDFYSTAAQIIPLMFIVLVVERKFFEPAERAVGPGLDNLTVAPFVLGETSALIALERGKAGAGTLALVVGPLVLGGLFLIGPIVNPRIIRTYNEAKRRRFPALAIAAVGVDVLLVYALPLTVLAIVVVRAFI